MNQTQTEAAASNMGSKVISDRVRLLVVSALLAAAVIVIYRLSFAHFRTKKVLETLKDEVESLRSNPTDPEDSTHPPASTSPFLSWVLDYGLCDSDWEENGESCYYFSTSRLNWTQSRAECKRLGSDLVQINSRDEQRFLMLRLKEKMNFDDDKFWIGLTDSKEQGKWLWVDDSPLNERLSFWIGSDPDNWTGKGPDGENCASMGVKQGAEDLKCWFDRPCDMHQSIICETPAETGLY